MSILIKGSVISLMILFLSGSALATYHFHETYYIKKNEFRTGEIVWVGGNRKGVGGAIVNQVIPSNNFTKDGQKAGVVVVESGNIYPLSGGMTIPNNADTFGMNSGFAWTLAGHLSADYGNGEKEIWRRELSQIFMEPQTDLFVTENITQQALLGTVGALKTGPNVKYTLKGEVYVVIYCRNSANGGCKIPNSQNVQGIGKFSMMLNPISIGLTSDTFYPAIDGTPVAVPILNKQLYLLFEQLNSCTFEVSPTFHDVGTLSKSSENNLLTAGKDFISKFKIDCTNQTSRPKVTAKLMFGSPLGVVEGNKAKTNIEGIGIVYSNKKIEKCTDGKMYYTNQPFGVGDIATKPVLEQEIHFGVCRYLPPEQIIPNKLNASVTYQYWLDDLPIPEN